MADSANSTKHLARKYSVAEIDEMRRYVGALYPCGVSYRAHDRAADVEDRLRTHMQNGTEPSELAVAVEKHFEKELQAKEAERKMRESAPPPRVLVTAEDVIDEWFQTCVAKYVGASAASKDLYDGHSGRTLKSFANCHAPDGVYITQRAMEKYIDRRGFRSRSAIFAKRYDGIMCITFGNVRSGSFMT